WLGVCPRQHESNRTKKKRGPRKGKNRVAIALRMAAQGLARTRSPLALFYRRIKSRPGGQGAITAPAHQAAVLVGRDPEDGREYARQSLEEYERKLREQQERSLRRKAASLGFDLVARGAATPS